MHSTIYAVALDVRLSGRLYYIKTAAEHNELVFQQSGYPQFILQ